MKKLLLTLLLSISIPAVVIGSIERYLDRKAEEFMEFYDEYLLNPKLLHEIDEVKTQDVVFTSYYQGDSTGSGDITGSGLTTDDFSINEKGWYTYQGKVVIATATYECLVSSDGACSMYHTVPKGYHVKKYFDEMIISVNGVDYQAIVLDSCGASFWNEERQRVDIYVSDKYFSVGKIYGSISY